MSLYSFAGLTIEMSPSFPLLRSRARPYLFSGDCAPDFSLSLPPELYESARDGAPELTDDKIEYMYMGSLFYRRLLCYDGMMLHSSAVAYDGCAYLFTAPPGTGKSTHTSSWLRVLGGRAFIINDDKPALRFFDGRLYACGTPFSGTSPLSANVRVPVGAICILRRGDRDVIREIAPEEALPIIYSQTITTLSRGDGARFLDILSRVVLAAPLYIMECTVGDGAARLAIERMTGRRFGEDNNIK